MDKYQKYILDKFRTNNSHLYIFSSCHPLNNEETDQKKNTAFLTAIQIHLTLNKMTI